MSVEKLFVCTSFPNYSAIQALVIETTARKAQSAAADPYYGRPEHVREATDEDIAQHVRMGGTIIGDRRRAGDRRQT